MNQILITDSNKSKKSKIKEVKVRVPGNPGDISNITKIFTILILIFGIALSGDGAYAIINNIENAKSTKVPVVEVLKNGGKVKLSIECETGIRTVSYAWNESIPTILQGRGNSLVEQTIPIPVGENQLHITVIDAKGQTRRYVKTLKQEAKDINEPTIKFEVVNSNIKIIATDDVEIDYITYRYGDTQEVTVTAKEEGLTTIEELVPVTQGENTLIVEAVDKAQNVATISQKIKGAKRPTIEVTPDPNDASYIIIKVYDDDGLRMISYYINGQEYKTDPNISLNSKTFEWKQKMDPGENRILIHAYNISEQVTEFDGIYNY